MNPPKRKHSSRREDYEEILRDAILNAREALQEIETGETLFGQRRPSQTPSALMRELIESNMKWDPEQVWHFYTTYATQQLDDNIAIYQKKAQEVEPHSQYGSRTKELRAIEEYESNLLWLVNLLAARNLIEEFAALELEGRLLQNRSILSHPSTTEQISKLYQDTMEKRKALSEHSRNTKDGKTKKADHRLFQIDHSYSIGAKKKVPKRKASTRKADAPASDRQQTLQEPGGEGHWEFLSYGGWSSRSEQELAQVQLQDSEYVDHNGEITPYDVRQVQMDHPGLFEIELVWVRDRSQGPVDEASTNEGVQEPVGEANINEIEESSTPQIKSQKLAVGRINQNGDKNGRMHYHDGNIFVKKSFASKLINRHAAPSTTTKPNVSKKRRLAPSESRVGNKRRKEAQDEEIRQLRSEIADLAERWNQIRPQVQRTLVSYARRQQQRREPEYVIISSDPDSLEESGSELSGPE